jgi:uncharacterized SAM-binding protein YcdF (DUF218 family)
VTDLLFTLKKFFSAAVLLPTGPLLLAMTGLLLARRWPRTGRAITWGSLIALLLFATPLVEHALVDSIKIPATDIQRADGAQAIVILGGGARRGTAEFGDTVSEYSLERVRYGAKLAKKLGLPVLVTSGAVFAGQAESLLMAKVLDEDFGVHTTWIEDRSRDTHQNAQLSAALLLPLGIRRILLVTHDVHERRSIAEFRHAGFDVIPAPVTSLPPGPGSFIEALPGASALRNSDMALHEIIGNLVLGPK